MCPDIPIQWEDEDSDFDFPETEKAEGEDTADEAEKASVAFEELDDDSSAFADLLATEGQGLGSAGPYYQTGDQVTGTVMSYRENSVDVFVDVPGRFSAVIEKREIMKDGQPEYVAGDSIKAYIVSKKDGVLQLSFSLGKAREAERDLELAAMNDIPVRGKVLKENKGGFDVQVFGKTAFCPVSQMDVSFVDVKALYVGKDFDFLIDKADPKGRNIVVSRARLLRKEAAGKIEALKAQLDDKPIVTGEVKEVKDFGAIVDLGGYTGFVHISELSYSRVENAKDLLKTGETVRARVISIDDSGDRTRISLSMKAIEDDPWQSPDLKEGDNFTAKITKLQDFGAFAEIKPGLEGLIHVSEMSWVKRVRHPEELLSVGDEVSVRVLGIDRERKRISLSLKDLDSDPWAGIEDKLPIGGTVSGQVEQLKGFGAIIALTEGVTGLLPVSTLKRAYGESYRKKCSPPQTVEVKVEAIDTEAKKVLLTLPHLEAEDAHNQDYKEYLASFKKDEDKVSRSSASDAPKKGSLGEILAATLSKKS